MFTGIIQAVCVVKNLDSSSISIDLADLIDHVRIGDSVAVNGACLTVRQITAGTALFDISPETFSRTTLGRLHTADKVNIELAMRPDDRFGGHIMQGHIDGIGKITDIRRKGSFAEITFTAPAELLDQMLPKGSVAVDGVSLTIAQMNTDGFTVALIPATLKNTTLGQARIGHNVNIETDLIVKSISKYIGRILGSKKSLTAEDLRQMGF
ncbi:MAG: riboflavin synthase [Planctomycetota bacterium]